MIEYHVKSMCKITEITTLVILYNGFFLSGKL